MAAVYRHRTSASNDATAGIFWARLSSKPPLTLLPPGRRHRTCNSVQRKLLAHPAQAHPEKVGALQVDSAEENRHLGSSDSRSTIRQLLKKYYFQEQNKTKRIPRVGERHHFLWIRWGFRIFFFFFVFYGRFCIFFFLSPRMKRSEKNKINHLSIVFSGMSSVSLGWGIRGMERGEWGEAQTCPRLHF